MKLKKNDEVVVLKGKDLGKRGKIEKVFPKTGKVLVGGVNLFKRHLKARSGKPGGIVDITKPLEVANLALICPRCGQKTRVGYKLSEREKKRICRKCGEVI